MRLRNALIGLIGVASLGTVTANADPIFEYEGHWYQYVDEVVSWQNAFDAAAASSYMGAQGYLATVTSAGEDEFLYSILSEFQGAGAWLGGSDADSEGTWVWMNGPEQGQSFTYENWYDPTGEPNDLNGEDYLQMTQRGWGSWNDLGGNDDWSLSGYFVEYSKVPEPGTLALLGLGLLGVGVARRRKA